MFATEITMLENGRIQHIKILENKTVLTYADVIQRWQDDQPFVATVHSNFSHLFLCRFSLGKRHQLPLLHKIKNSNLCCSKMIG